MFTIESWLFCRGGGFFCAEWEKRVFLNSGIGSIWVQFIDSVAGCPNPLYITLLPNKCPPHFTIPILSIMIIYCCPSNWVRNVNFWQLPKWCHLSCQLKLCLLSPNFLIHSFRITDEFQLHEIEVWYIFEDFPDLDSEKLG